MSNCFLYPFDTISFMFHMLKPPGWLPGSNSNDVSLSATFPSDHTRLISVLSDCTSCCTFTGHISLAYIRQLLIQDVVLRRIFYWLKCASRHETFSCICCDPCWIVSSIQNLSACCNGTPWSTSSSSLLALCVTSGAVVQHFWTNNSQKCIKQRTKNTEHKSVTN